MRRMVRIAAAAVALALMAGGGVHAHGSPSAPPPPPAASKPGAPRAPLSLAALLHPQSLYPLPAAPKHVFTCLNAGFYMQRLPLAFVGDGVCDCCDGSDERIDTATGEGNPWFRQTADRSAAPIATTEANKAADAAAQEKPASGGGGWLSSLLGSGSAQPASAAVASAQQQGPCPNTCASRAAEFLASFEARVGEYARGVAAKTARLKSGGLQRVQKALQAEIAQVASQFDAAVEVYHAAHAYHSDPRTGQSQASYDELMGAQHAASSLQGQLEHLKWIAGQPVPVPGSRPNPATGERPMRAPASLGPQREWLLLWGSCFDFEWPQRRWGAFGEQVDWYRMQLCPLSNATQQAIEAPTTTPTPPAATAAAPATTESTVTKDASAGESSSTAATDAQSTGETSEAAAATADEEEEGAEAAEEEPAQQFVLGWWQGEILSSAQQEERARVMKARAEAAAAAAAAGASSDPPGSLSASASPTPASRAPPAAPYSPPAPPPAPGSVLASTPEPSYLISLRGGENCWQVGPRQAEVELRCGPTDRITGVEEDGKCRYRFHVQSPLACEQGFLQLLQGQLRDYRAWFARKAPAASSAATQAIKNVDESWAKHDEL